MSYLHLSNSNDNSNHKYNYSNKDVTFYIYMLKFTNRNDHLITNVKQDDREDCNDLK